jgi:hypothetical protein
MRNLSGKLGNVILYEIKNLIIYNIKHTDNNLIEFKNITMSSLRPELTALQPESTALDPGLMALQCSMTLYVDQDIKEKEWRIPGYCDIHGDIFKFKIMHPRQQSKTGRVRI